MQGIPGLKQKGGSIKLIIILIIIAVAVYFLSKAGIITLPFKLPF